MPSIRVLRDRFRALWRSSRVHDEIDEELRFHVDMRARANVARGMTSADARSEATRTFGRLTYIKELAYDVRGGGALESMGQDFRYAIRGLRAKPGMTIAIVLTLALGMGANTAMFAIVDRALFRPPAYLVDPSSAHRVYATQFRRGALQTGNVRQYARYIDLSAWTHSFSKTAAFAQQQLAVGVGEASREMLIGTVSASFFDFFNAPPAIGRYFGPSEDAPPVGASVAVLSYSTWKTEYGGRADVLGSHVLIGTVNYTIIGVTPKGFVGVSPDSPSSYWVPITSYAAAQAATFKWLKNGEWWKTYSWGWLSMLARRKPGVTVAAANADLTSAMNRSLDAERGGSSRASSSRAVPASALVASVLEERGPDASAVTKVSVWVAGVAAIVLLITCANVANLLLARALRRRREIALRLALGIGSIRLVSQLLMESLILAAIGGTAGLLVAYGAGSVLHSTLLADSAPSGLFADSRALPMTIAVVALVGLLTGLAPILQARRADLTRDLKAGARAAGTLRSRLRVGLLVFQAALSTLLLVGAGLFVRSLENVDAIRLGYDTEPVLLVNVNMRGVKLDSARDADLRHRLVAAATGVPGVTYVSERNATPFISTKGTLLFVDGIDTVSKLGQFDENDVSPDYFRTVGTRILRGRAFANDDSPIGPRVMIVSQAMAERLWPGRDAIGQCVRVNADTMPCTRVVAVAENIRNQSMSDDRGYYYYLPAAQVPLSGGGLFVRVDGSAAEYSDVIRRRLQREMPGASYVTTTPFADVLGSQTASWKMGAIMFTAFGALALIVAAIGLYSVIAYDVEQRTRELGVRLALGAQAHMLVVMVIRQGVLFAAIGVTTGIIAALTSARWVEPLLYNESPRDPLVFGFVGAVLLGVAVAASWTPAWRASRVDAQIALRSD